MYIDTHTHMISRTTDDYELMARAGVVACIEPAFWLGQPRTNVGSYIDYLSTIVGWERFRAGQFGLRHYCTVGLNSKEANNEELAEAVMEILPRFALKEGVVAIGEVGYDEQTAEEDRYFRQQLELARELEMPVMVHTPHRDKKRGTTRSMDVLEEHGLDPSWVVIDHNNEETAQEVLDRGFWAGFSIYPGTCASMGSSFRLSERFWSLARRLIPKPARVHPLGGGRPRVPDRRVLAAIFFVLRTGCQWKALDATGLGSGSTAHRRFQEWIGAGFFFRLWRVAARRYDEVRGIDWRWLAIDGCLTKAPLSRSEMVGRNPTDRGKQGSKRSLLVDGEGVPLALAVGPANRNDHLLLAETLDGLVARRPSPSTLVQHLCLDLGYDDAGSRREAARRGYVAHIRGRGDEVRERRRGARKRARRWAVERTHAWLNRSRRLLVRWERKAANHTAFLHLACALTCVRAAEASGTAGARR